MHSMLLFDGTTKGTSEEGTFIWLSETPDVDTSTFTFSLPDGYANTDYVRVTGPDSITVK